MGDDDGDDGVGMRLLSSKPLHSTITGSHPLLEMNERGGSEDAMEQTSP